MSTTAASAFNFMSSRSIGKVTRPFARCVLPVVLLVHSTIVCRADDFGPNDAGECMRKAIAFFRERVSTNGGYLWRYSADLSKREGEGKATPTQAWVQPPGTPAVGAAILRAYKSTRDTYYLDAAKDTAMALVQGQLQSGGWDYRIEFDPEERKGYAYRTDGNTAGNNTSTLDDDTTQAAVSFLMQVDDALGFSDPAIHESVLYALTKLIQVQYPNGAWPQRYDRPPDPAKYPVARARYPAYWSREYVQRDFRSDYTFNDNSISDTITTMMMAFSIYGDARYRDAALRAGDFILLAQMPDPQPGWAQQYDANMHPVWARKFEPPAITGGESQGLMKTLIDLYHETGESRYLDPLPRALAYYRGSELPGRRLARFYELHTNRPLYLTKDYVLTYEADDLPTHYGFIVGSALDEIEVAFQNARRDGPKPERRRSAPVPVLTPELAARAQAAVSSIDRRGAWLEPGRLPYHGDDNKTDQIISTATFARNIGILSDYLDAVRANDESQATPNQGE
ncbi:MAG: hypothetical protein AMXMBFR4_06370 [Candidatus Hydrogenedentota bacterium]